MTQITKFELDDLEKSRKLIEPYLNKNYYFLLIDVANEYRCCCRRYVCYVEIHDSLTIKQLKNWFIETKTDDLEVDQISVYKNFDDLINESENVLGKADLEYKVRDYSTSIWKGYLGEEKFEVIHKLGG